MTGRGTKKNGVIRTFTSTTGKAIKRKKVVKKPVVKSYGRTTKKKIISFKANGKTVKFKVRRK